MATYSNQLKVFISYSHNNMKEKEELVKFLGSYPNHYELLSDDLLLSGVKWEDVLTRFLADADVFLLLISPSYLASFTVKKELEHIMKRGREGNAYVIPLILESCEWSQEAFSIFQVLPKFGQPVSSLPDVQDFYRQLTEALQQISFLLYNGKALEIIKKCKASKNPVLDLSSCNLNDVPRDLSVMPWLKKLRLDKNSIEKINHLQKLTDLEMLDLSDNKIRELDNLDTLVNLQFLDLERNQISVIKDLGNLEKLETLGVSTNNLTSLEGLSGLTNLTTLYAARNKITSTEELAGHPKLTRIVLTDNLITSIRPLVNLITGGIPVQLKYAIKEKEAGIFVKGNPVSDPPLEVIEMGNIAILDHFKKGNEHGEKKLEVLKLILVGNSGVGKTNFSQFLRKQEMNSAHLSTDTLDIQQWKAPFLKSESGEAMLVNIFDFGGQDYYHDLHRLYYSHDTAYILLWDAASNAYRERREHLADDTELAYEDFPIEYWLESIRYNLTGKAADYFEHHAIEKGDTVFVNKPPETPVNDPALSEQSVVPADLSTTAPVLVLQNKIDLGEGLLNQVVLQNAYPNITTFYNVSLSKNNRTSSIEEVMDACLGKLNLAGRKLVVYQHEIIENYLEGRIDFEVLTLEAFRVKCSTLLRKNFAVLDISDAKTIASILTNLGVIYYYRPEGVPDEEGVVFTRIDRLNELIKEIMIQAKLGSDKGFFERSQVPSFTHFEEVLTLLVKNYSIISLGENQFLVPQFLPVAPASHVAKFARAFVHCQIRYVYTAYFHKSTLMSLFAKFVGRQHKTDKQVGQVKAVYYWRNGLILSEEIDNRTQMVFVKFIKEPKACSIEIRSLRPFSRSGLERDIEKELDELNKGWTCTKEVSANSEDFFEVSKLRQSVKDNIFTFKGASQHFTVNDFKHLVSFEKIPKKLFVSYSSKNAAFLHRFWIHLDVLRTAGYIEPWYDRKIEPGSRWDDNIQKEMLSSDLVIFLLSPDFLATPYIMNEEVRNAIKMESAKQCELFFIQLQSCNWEHTELVKYQMLLEPADPGKTQVYVENPDNDVAWKKIMTLLIDKIRQ